MKWVHAASLRAADIFSHPMDMFDRLIRVCYGFFVRFTISLWGEEQFQA